MCFFVVILYIVWKCSTLCYRTSPCMTSTGWCGWSANDIRNEFVSWRIFSWLSKPSSIPSYVFCLFYFYSCNLMNYHSRKIWGHYNLGFSFISLCIFVRIHIQLLFAISCNMILISMHTFHLRTILPEYDPRFIIFWVFI